jgi:hypothetical protein
MASLRVRLSYSALQRQLHLDNLILTLAWVLLSLQHYQPSAPLEHLNRTSLTERLVSIVVG